ncbi:MAG: GTP-binding protein [Candidatus Heimdallarchaeota archaeon]|nr:GTP-binding protein [Candidatus Heimdallarchaeota archaeon]
MLDHKPEIIAISVLGDAATGKTSLVRKFSSQEFRIDEVLTIGAQFTFKNNFNLEHKRYGLRICDVAGINSISSLRMNFLRNSQGAIVVFDLTRPESINNLAVWIHDFLAANNYNTTLPILLVGTKLDLIEQRKLRLTDIQKIINSFSASSELKPNIIGFIETSSMTGEGVDACFDTITKHIAS